MGAAFRAVVVLVGLAAAPASAQVIDPYAIDPYAPEYRVRFQACMVLHRDGRSGSPGSTDLERIARECHAVAAEVTRRRHRRTYR